MNNEISVLGLCQKAGKLKSGSFQVEEAIKSGNAFLVIASKDASENTAKKYRDMCDFRHVPFYIYATAGELGEVIGKESRVVIAITDEKLAELVKGKLALR